MDSLNEPHAVRVPAWHACCRTFHASRARRRDRLYFIGISPLLRQAFEAVRRVEEGVITNHADADVLAKEMIWRAEISRNPETSSTPGSTSSKSKAHATKPAAKTAVPVIQASIGA